MNVVGKDRFASPNGLTDRLFINFFFNEAILKQDYPGKAVILNRYTQWSLQWVFLVMLILSCIHSAQSQSFYGPGGLFVHPSAFAPPKGGLSMSITYGQQYVDGFRAEYLPSSFAYGVTDRLSVGTLIVYHQGHEINYEPMHDHVHVGGFLKYQFSPDDRRGPATALAVSYRGHDDLETLAAVVASHTFRSSKPLFSGHLGLKYGRAPSGADSIAAYTGLEVPFNRSFKLFGEYGTRFSFDYKEASSIGIAYSAGRSFNLSVGMVNLGRSQDNRFFVGVGYPIGGIRR